MANYVTESELREYLRMGSAVEDDPDSNTLQLAIAAASAAIEQACGRSFEAAGDTSEARYFTVEYDKALKRYVIPIDDTTDTELTVADDDDDDGTGEADLTGFRLAPYNAPAKGRPYTTVVLAEGSSPTSRMGAMVVTAKWGWDAVPDTVKAACLLQASRLVKRRDAPFGVAGSPEMGSQVRLLARLDPDVELMLKSAGLTRRWAAF